jgi:CubicO group peptidase (beta-lactamase class C family)
MKMSAAAVIVVVMASAPSAQGPTKVLGFSDAGKAALTQQMDDAVKRGDTPGVAELVVERRGILFEGAAGKADIERGVDAHQRDLQHRVDDRRSPPSQS